MVPLYNYLSLLSEYMEVDTRHGIHITEKAGSYRQTLHSQSSHAFRSIWSSSVTSQGVIQDLNLGGGKCFCPVDNFFKSLRGVSRLPITALTVFLIQVTKFSVSNFFACKLEKLDAIS